ncbi:redoxin domain-containing protein [Rhizobium leguminosarum]|uniref:redoxin domain-containing protein n=1 Tax=Rhizobium leguminosarum TaxID=384 RepID=UPI0021B09049|nr:redoxin domain-containing protein [Rhizobium leguminosarum]
MTSSLNSGSPAPSIEALDWLRGDRLPNFKLGKIYILDFFATGCGYSRSSLTHLAQLQEGYRDMGVEVIAVASRE